MIVQDSSITYKILDSEIKFYSEDTVYGWNVVAEYNNDYFYLGDKTVGIELAVLLWQEQNALLLSSDELKQVMIDNKLTV